jgi:putative CocE/NonD family hydrolase
MLSSYQVVLWKQESFVVLRQLQIEFFRNLLEQDTATEIASRIGNINAVIGSHTFLNTPSSSNGVPHGYVVVLQDVRGRYKSEGHWRPHFDDPNDGFDTAQWIGSQLWCDGGIGTLGTSYAGATQHALAIGNAPYIKAMVPGGSNDCK